MYNSHSQSEYILKAKLYKPFYPPVTIIALAITRIAIYESFEWYTSYLTQKHWAHSIYRCLCMWTSIDNWWTKDKDSAAPATDGNSHGSTKVLEQIWSKDETNMMLVRWNKYDAQKMKQIWCLKLSMKDEINMMLEGPALK